MDNCSIVGFDNARECAFYCGACESRDDGFFARTLTCGFAYTRANARGKATECGPEIFLLSISRNHWCV
jgi:hypothetical protein